MENTKMCSRQKINSLFLVLLLLTTYSNALMKVKFNKKINPTNLSETSSQAESLKSILGLTSKTSSLASSETKQASSSKPMENSGYLFYGYNLYRGNPHSTSGSLDPGFTNPIFDSDYSSNTKTGDLRFLIPNGSIFAKNVGCDVSLSNSEIRGVSSYKASLEADVSVSGGFSGVSFGASASFKQVSEGMKSTNTVYVESKADCRVFKGHIEYYDPPLFYTTFLKAISFLSNREFETNKENYYIFIDYYGTHFLDTIVMGARYGFLQKMTSEEYSNYSSTSAKVSISAGGFGFSGSAGVGVDKSQSNSGASMNKDTKVFSIGAAPPADGDAMTWASSAITEPMPISYKLRPIMEIFNNSLFNLSQLNIKGKVDVEKFKANLQKAYDNYCPDYLMKNGIIKYCTNAEIPAIELGIQTEVKISEIPLTPKSIVMLRNMSTGTCLTLQGENILASTCNGKDDTQKFYFNYHTNTLTYRLYSILHKGKVADRAAGRTTEMIFFDQHDANNQRIVLKKKDMNLYYLAIENLCLAIRDDNKADNAFLFFDSCREESKQQWRLIQV